MAVDKRDCYVTSSVPPSCQAISVTGRGGSFIAYVTKFDNIKLKIINKNSNWWTLLQEQYESTQKNLFNAVGARLQELLLNC